MVQAVGVGLAHTPDPIILAWAASHGRILITGDLNTMVGFARDRVIAAQPMPGVLVPEPTLVSLLGSSLLMRRKRADGKRRR